MWNLDTNAVIAYLNGNRSVGRKSEAHLGASAVGNLVMAEMLYGARKSDSSGENLQKLQQFLELVDVFDFNMSCANAYGQIRNDLVKKGRPSITTLTDLPTISKISSILG